MDHTDDFETISTLSDSGLSNSYSENKSFRTISPPPDVSRQRKNKKQGEVESVFQEEKETKTTQPEIPSTSKQCIGDNRSPQKQQLLLLQSENIEIPATVESDIKDGFSCFISTAEGGQIMYVTKSVTKTLGFPKDMLIGRSFADFLHPMDRLTLASLVKNGIIIKKNEPGAGVRLPKKSAQEAWLEAQTDCISSGNNTVFTMMCRIRRYRGLSGGFAVRNRQVSFMPFMLKLYFKKFIGDKRRDVIYLLVQATRLFSNFRVPNEIVLNPLPFVMKHAANGDILYLDPTSIPYLGYTSQDIINKNALKLYHPHDLEYLKEVYKTIVQGDGGWRSKPYRLLAHNGQYVSVETEWCSFINTSSMKLDFVVGKHFIIKGPCNPDVFQFDEQVVSFPKDDEAKFKSLRESIILIMTESLPKPVEAARPQEPKRSHNLAAFLKSLTEEEPRPDEIRLKTEETDSACSNSVLQREDITNRLKDTLQRYFDTTSTEFIQTKVSPMPESFTSTYPGTLANFSSIKLTESALKKHNWNLEQQDIYKARVFKKKSKKFERKEPGGDNNASIVPTTSSRFVEESDPNKPKGTPRDSDENDLKVDVPRKNR